MWHFILVILGWRTYFIVSERTNVTSSFTWRRPKGRRLATTKDIEEATVSSVNGLYFRRAFDAHAAMTNSMHPLQTFFTWQVAARSSGGVPLGWILKQESLRFAPGERPVVVSVQAETFLPYLVNSPDGILAVCFRSELVAAEMLRRFLERRHEEIMTLLRPLMARWQHYENMLSRDLSLEHREFFQEQADLVEASMEIFQGERLILEQQLL